MEYRYCYGGRKREHVLMLATNNGQDSVQPHRIFMTITTAQLNLRSAGQLFMTFAFLFMLSATSFAQEAGNAEVKARHSKMMETQFFMNQLMQLGFNNELRKELEVVNAQVDSIKKLAQDYQKDMMEFHSNNRESMLEVQKLCQDGKHEEARELTEEFQKKQTEFNDSYLEQAAETLLPHQIDRLRQIAKQQRVKNMNQFQDEFGIAASMADELGMGAAEKKRLIDTIKEARKEYYEAVASAKEMANEKITSALTTEQQEKMKEILGDNYDQSEMLRRMREDAMKKQKEAMKTRK